MHGWASPGASKVNHFHSVQLSLCTQPMANKLLVGGTFTLSMTFGASLNWDSVCWYNAHIIKCLWPFGGNKDSSDDVWLALSPLPSEVIFWISLILNWHTVQAPWENKTELSTSESGLHRHDMDQRLARKCQFFFSPPAVHRPLLRCGRACTFPKTFPHCTPN